MENFEQEQTQPYFDRWEIVASEIEQLYEEKNKQAIPLMNEAIENYERLLLFGGKEVHSQSKKSDYILLPLNGEERLAFVKKRIQSHYAYVQLNMLYGETKKKVARLRAIGAQQQRNK